MKKQVTKLALILILTLMLSLTACGNEDTPADSSTPTPPVDIVTPDTQPAPEETPENTEGPALAGTWSYLTTALGNEGNLRFEPIISPYPPYLEIYENNTIQMFSHESVIKAVFTQTNDNQDSQCELSVTELSQIGEDGGEWHPEFDIALTYDAKNGVLRWTFLEGDAYITNVHHYYILSFESMDKEVNVVIDDFDVIVDEEHGMNWEQYTLPRLAVYAHYMDGAYSEGISRELYKRFMEIPHIVLPYIALIGEETIRDDLPMPTTRELLCNDIIYGGAFSQNPSELFLEVLDKYDEIYPSGSVADVVSYLRNELTEAN